VADIMQRDLVTVQVGDSLRDVERILADERISGAPVLDADERLVGIVSMADLVRRYAEEQDLPDEADYPRFGDDVDETELVAFSREQTEEACVGDVMSSDVAALPPSASLREAAALFVTRGIHRLLVVDRGRVRGLVSTLDVMRALADLQPTE
jgi:CBS domain-containing protein